MFDSLSVPVIFAHRGASAHAPENTMPAFKLAASQGAEAIELDVQLSADGAVVVFHDRSVSRTTNGIGKIHQLTLEQLKSMHAGAEFGSAYPDAEIPTLAEVLNELDPELFLNIELKSFNVPFDSLAARVAAIVKDFHAENRVLFSSFNPFALIQIGRHLPDVPRGLLLYKPIDVDLILLLPRLISNCQAINVSFPCITNNRVAALHNLGKKVFVYTLNHHADILTALDSGVDGFFTDDPPLGFRTLTGSGYNRSKVQIDPGHSGREIIQ